MVAATIRTASQGTSSKRSGTGFARGCRNPCRDSVARGRGELLTDFVNCQRFSRLAEDLVVVSEVEFVADTVDLNVTAALTDFLHLRDLTS
jgi:hypothetical protein